MSAAAASRIYARGLAGVIAVGAVTAGLATVQRSTDLGVMAAANDAVTLADDDRGGALFDIGNLAPGTAVTRCIELSYAGAAGAGVQMSASGSGSGLDRHLRLTVEGGKGGGFDDCAGFAGRQLFAGTLAEFLARFPDEGSALGAWSADPDHPNRTFRVSMELEDVAAAQGKRAAVSFRWHAGGTIAVDKAPSAPGGSPGVVALPAPSGAKPAPRGRPHPGPAARDRVARTPGVVRVPQDRGTPAIGGPASRTARSPRPDAPGGVRRVIAAVADASVEVAKRGAVPVFLIVLLLLYLLLQDRLDRRDPKLMLAPIHRAPDLPFEPLHGAGGDGP